MSPLRQMPLINRRENIIMALFTATWDASLHITLNVRIYLWANDDMPLRYTYDLVDTSFCDKLKSEMLALYALVDFYDLLTALRNADFILALD